MNIERKKQASIDFYFFLVLVLSIPLHFRVTSSVFIIWAVSWLIQKIFVEKNKNWFKFEDKHRRMLFFIAMFYYFILAASLLWSTKLNIGLHTLETKLALLVVPIVLINVNSVYNIEKQLIYKFFLGGLILSSVACIAIAIFASFNGPNFELGANFYYTTFSKFSHPSYFSMFIAFGILILKLNLVKFKKNNALTSYLIIAFFLLILFFLSSKAGIFITYLILFIDIVLNIIKKKTFKVSFIEIAILGIFFFLTINLNARKPVSSVTNTSNFESATPNQQKQYNSTASRVVIWKSALEVYKTNYLLGVGIGDLKLELSKEFEKRGFKTGIERNYNAHNQYFEDGLNAGILANLALIFLFLIPFVINLRAGNYLAVYFIAIVAMNFLFESMLEKQNGVMFFAIFYGLLAFADKKLPSKQSKNQ